MGPLRRRLAPRPSSVGVARKLVRHTLGLAGRDDLLDVAELLVSEVVTNALLHAGTPIDVSLSMLDKGLLVQIGDGSPHLPVRRAYASTAGTGRGLMLLEQMVEYWGVVPNAAGKTVWFHLRSGNEDALGSAFPATLTPAEVVATAPVSTTLAVRFLNHPLMLHAAWQEHAQTLLREYLLVNLDTGSEAAAIERHADATDAISILGEQVPRLEVRLDPDQVVSHAVEPRVSAIQVDIVIPLLSVQHFDVLNQTLEAATAMADNDVFLTPPTQPEVRIFRRWMCGEVDEQSRGADPVPWAVATESLRETHRGPNWDPAPVADSFRAVVAADDNNRILAASRSVLDLLGYDDPDELVGQRIVALIPSRYRQAHIAGFTMHLLVGHSPLIGTTVRVPALQRDGSEVEIELTVVSQYLPPGRQIFLAEMNPVPSTE